ncbi:MAG: hypothetical protein ABSB26_03305 [Nitrososphaerales archaeon]|jgi:hypothetical protein
MSEPEPNYVQQARDYCSAIKSFDLIVSEKATREKWTVEIPELDDKKKVTRTFAELLSLYMSGFELYDGDKDPRMKVHPQHIELVKSHAIFLVDWVYKGLTMGLITQGQGLVGKWEKAEAESREKGEMITTLRASMERMFEECPRCHFRKPDDTLQGAVEGVSP